MTGSSERIAVSAEVIVWARKTAGWDSVRAAKRLGVSESMLLSWESGAKLPTIKQLRAIAELYKRPLAVLLLPKPPRDFDALRDLRTAGPGGSERPWSPALHAEFKRANAQREVFLELREISPSVLPESHEQLRIAPAGASEDAAAHLRGFLGLGQWGGRWQHAEKALKSAIAALESRGVIVIQTQRVAPEEARGFSVSAWPFPVVALNGADAVRGRLFTLFHELCHVALNASSLCDLHEKRSRANDVDSLEHYCNEVAAAVLMPSNQVLANAQLAASGMNTKWTIPQLEDFARPFAASSEAFLLRLISLGKANWELYWQLKPEFERLYSEARARQREAQRASESGPSFYVIKARDLGHGYVSRVLEAFQSRAISTLDVADYLYVRYEQVPKLAEVVAP